jgi:signal peptidase
VSAARRTGAFIGQVCTWLVILAAGAALTAAVLVPRLGGGTPYAVLTGSMRPDLPPRTLVVVRPVPFGDIAIGDVITYQLESGEATVVTHRVVGIGVNVDGERVLTTKGDANRVVDPKPVREVQVKGRLWYSVPQLGRLHQALTGQERQWAVYAVAVLLFGYAAMTWGAALRDRIRHRDRPDEREEEPDEATTPHAPTSA